MSPNTFRFFMFVVSLALLSPAPLPAPPASHIPPQRTELLTTNLGLAIEPLTSQTDGSYTVFLVSEYAQGRTDLNGDGDTFDSVLHLHNLDTGVTINLGYAVRYFPISGVSGKYVIRGSYLVFLVDEVRQGATDINGDGDAFDWVPHVYDISTGVTTSLGWSADHLTASDTIVTFGSMETTYGAGTDLNSDGDTNDTVLFWFDINTVNVNNSGLPVFNPLCTVVNDQYIATTVSETGEGKDLNNDGDMGDRVLHIIDTQGTGATNLSLAVDIYNNYSLHINEDYLLFFVSEINQSADLNGDGDLTDNVSHVIQFSTLQTTNFGLAAEVQKLNNHLAALAVSESDQGNSDLNNDGDATDTVFHVIHLDTGDTINTFLSQGPLSSYDFEVIQIRNHSIAFLVDEMSQGNSDLNNDGDTADEIVYIFNTQTDSSINLDVATTQDLFDLSDDHLVIMASEASNGFQDLNGDGDTLDTVLILHNIDLHTTVSLYLVGSNAHIQKDVIVYISNENDISRDLNGDGDILDRVLSFYKISTGQVGHTGLANLYDPKDMSGRWLLHSVSEVDQGRVDLNGDGDTSDLVLFKTRVN